MNLSQQPKKVTTRLADHWGYQLPFCASIYPSLPLPPSLPSSASSLGTHYQRDHCHEGDKATEHCQFCGQLFGWRVRAMGEEEYTWLLLVLHQGALIGYCLSVH